MSNIEKAKVILAQGEYTCVLCAGERCYTSTKRGVAPLLELLERGIEKNFSAADKVVGRAAAYLYVLLGAGEVYANVMSATALEVFERYNIPVSFGEKTETIFNRTLTGLCPMESAVLGIDEPNEALAAIKLKLKQLKGN